MNRIGQELLEAARENNLPEVERLLSIGADVNVKGSLGSTPLIEASIKRHVQLVRELLDHGAEIIEAKRSRSGSTSLHFACCRQWHLAVVIELRNPNDSNGTTTTLGKRKS
jgi:ankyrin repeat protein